MIETFEEATSRPDPAYAVDEAAFTLVFDANDGFTEHLDRLSPEARLIYQVCRFESEIHSEGFGGFLTNPTGDHCEALLAHLGVLGASNSLRMLRAAMACFPNGVVPSNRAEREAIWFDAIEGDEVAINTLSALDQEFYAYDDNLCGLMNDYVRAHPEIRVGA